MIGRSALRDGAEKPGWLPWWEEWPDTPSAWRRAIRSSPTAPAPTQAPFRRFELGNHHGPVGSLTAAVKVSQGQRTPSGWLQETALVALVEDAPVAPQVLGWHLQIAGQQGPGRDPACSQRGHDLRGNHGTSGIGGNHTGVLPLVSAVDGNDGDRGIGGKRLLIGRF